MKQDVIIIGGGFAGMSAALPLLSARRNVLVIDAGLRRNRAADHARGFLGQDGINPNEIADTSRKQVEAYPTLTWQDANVARVSGEKDNFAVTTEDGERFDARRVIFATGVSDTLPDIEGVSDRWGKSVFHCPYCHGYDLNQGEIGLIATGQISVHMAQILPDWGKVTILINNAFELDDETRSTLIGRGVSIELTPVARVKGYADIELVDGRELSFTGLFLASRVAPASPVAQLLGCELEETQMGVQTLTDDTKETTVAGAYACGDAAHIPHSITLSAADGAWAGVNVHRSLMI